ncbi:App1 family protein [Brachybacterium huguangmaarense]
MRPHWAARIEDVKNRVAARALRTIGWDVRLQPYTGYGTTGRIRVLAKVLYAAPGTPADYHDQPVHDMRTMAVRGFRSFTSQCSPMQRVRIVAGGEAFTAHADRTGIVDAMLDVTLPPGTHQVTLSTHPGNEVTAEVIVFDPEQRLGVVSDIDDTVMVTWLPRPFLAFWNAFVIQQSSRKVVPGMPLLYQEISRANPHVPFVYLSTGAWNVFPVLRRFLFKNGYPDGPMLLTDWGPTNTGLFRSGMEHKLRSLDTLHATFPGMHWLLVGDDGQHDPEIYGRFSTEHPDAVAAVAIRQLTEAQQVLSHGTRHAVEPSEANQRAAAEAHVAWVEAPDGHRLIHALRRLGLVR